MAFEPMIDELMTKFQSKVMAVFVEKGRGPDVIQESKEFLKEGIEVKRDCHFYGIKGTITMRFDFDLGEKNDKKN